MNRLVALGIAPCIAAKLTLTDMQIKYVAAFIRAGLCPIAALHAALKEGA